MIRAFLTWLVVFVLLVLVAGMIEPIGVYEVLIILVASIGLTYLLLRARRRRAPKAGSSG